MIIKHMFISIQMTQMLILNKLNDDNYAYLYISGDSIYDYTLNVNQDGNDSCTYNI